MKRMKRIISASLLFAVTLLCSSTALAAPKSATPQPDEPIWVEPDLVNNVDYNITSIGGVYWENTFYVCADMLAFFANGTVVEETREFVAMDLFARRIVIYYDGSVVDFLAGGETGGGALYSFTLPVMEWQGRIYASMLHLYRYLGIEIAFAYEAKQPVHLYINCPYTIYDALGEYVELMDYYYFGLDEVLKDGLGSDIIKKSAALDTMLIHYDSNILNHSFGTTNASRDLLADCLVEIVREEGADYADETLAEAKTFSDRAALGVDVDNTIFDMAQRAAEAAGSTTPAVSEALGKTLGKANLLAQIASIYFDTMGVYRMYEAIPAEQVELLKSTLCRVNRGSMYEAYPLLFDTAAQVQERVEDSMANIAQSLERARDSTVSTLLSNTKQSFFTAAFGWPYAAINAVYSVTVAFAETDPVLGEYVGDEIALTQARGCMDVQNMALQLFMSDFSDFMDSDLYYDDPNACLAALERLQSDMLLVLKSGMAARRLLSDTVYADETEREYLSLLMQDSAVMVGKLENARLLLPGYPNDTEGAETALGTDSGPKPLALYSSAARQSPVDDDISWLPDLAVVNNGGSYVSHRGLTFYWQIDPAFYAGDATVFANYGVNRDVSNTLVCRDRDGKVTELLTAPGHGDIYIAGGSLFWHYDTRADGNWGYEIHSCGLDGSGEAIVAMGQLKGYDQLSGSLVYEGSDGGVYVYRPADGKSVLAAENARVLQVANGNVYYEKESTDHRTMSIWKVSAENPEQDGELLVSTVGDPTGEYSGSAGYSWFCVNSCVHGDYLYLVSGVYAGTGYIFQGGCIGRVKLDGSGEYELIDGGGDATTEDSIFVYTVDGVTYINYVLYGRDTNWEYKITKMNLDDGTAAMGGSTIAERQYSYPAGEVYYTAEGFKMNDQQEGGPVMLLTAEEVEALGFEPYFQTGGERGYTHIGATSIVGDLFYFSLVENIRDDSNDVGWRYSYRLSHRAAYVKNMETGEITKLFDF